MLTLSVDVFPTLLKAFLRVPYLLTTDSSWSPPHHLEDIQQWRLTQGAKEDMNQTLWSRGKQDCAKRRIFTKRDISGLST